MMLNFVQTLDIRGLEWSERQDSNLRPLTPQISTHLKSLEITPAIGTVCSPLFRIGSLQLWRTLDRSA